MMHLMFGSGFGRAGPNLSGERSQLLVVSYSSRPQYVVSKTSGDSQKKSSPIKQDDVWVWLNGRKLDLLEHGIDLPEEVVRTEDRSGEPCEPVLDILDWADRRDLEPLRFDFPEGSRLDVVWTRQDNYYVYARLEDLNGIVWTGWSGYGVGAGLEDVDWGHSTEDRNRTLVRIWPDAIREQLA